MNTSKHRGPGNLGPLAILENILPEIEMPEFQNIGIREVLVNKKMCLSFDTGTGKTFTYAGIARALLNDKPEGKHILVIVNDSIEQVPKDVRNLTEVSVEAFDGSYESCGRLRFFWKRTSIFCLTLEAFQQMEILEFLFRHLPEIESLVIDEAHHCSNWNVSDTAFMIRSFARWIPYVVELTATPMTRESKQYYRLMNLLDRDMSIHRDETYLGKYIDRYMTVNRGDYEIKGEYLPTLVVVEPLLEQMKKQKGIVFRTIKGTGATPQIAALVSTVKERLRQGKRCIIYLHYHDTRHWVEQNFQEQGISFVSLHGRITKREERQAILDEFREQRVDVLITSVTESLNIDADVVIFYEFTTAVKQVIGRAHRGLVGKKLEIVFLITRNTDEVEYFMQYIYQRSLTIQKLLNKDYSELIKIGEQVKELRLSIGTEEDDGS